MANKLFKHFGFTSKKVSNQSSPSHEFNSSKNSSSIQDILPRSPPKNPPPSSTVVVSVDCAVSSASVRPDFEGRRHSDAAALQGSLPERGRNKSTPPGAVTEGSISRGSRPKDQRYASCRVPGSGSPATGQIRSRPQQTQSGLSSQLDSCRTSPSPGIESIKSQPNIAPASTSSSGTSPQILDEYSDPLDLKKVIEQNENVIGEATSSLSMDTVMYDSEKDLDQPLKCEDDYSVPYEIKERQKEDQVQNEKNETKSVPKYDDPYDEGPALFFSSVVVAENGNTDSVAVGDDQIDIGPVENISIVEEMSSTVCIAVDNNAIQPLSADPDGGATYDEPWDLRAARIGLENRLRAVHSSPDQLMSMSCIDHSQLNDPRPSLEYDEPWDRRIKDVHRNLISAKSAKEEARVLRESGFHSHIVPGTFHRTHESSSSRHRTAVTDPRNIPSLSRRDHDASGWSYRSTAQTGHTAKHKCGQITREFSSSHRPVAERIDPRVPLEQQGWYHGSISRVDAETLLRIHREGSYLVRMSESNRVDYSLSFKSARGFMHMKIVNTSCGHDNVDIVDSRYILGQFSQPFDSIPQMIHHYTINKLPIKGAEHMSLLHPVNNELL